jgi:hypothetical protein
VNPAVGVQDKGFYGNRIRAEIESQIQLRADQTGALVPRGTRINQLANYDIELDQSRYCAAIVKKYLDTAGAPRVDRIHSTPLPIDFVPTNDDCSANEEATQSLEKEYNIDLLVVSVH